MWACRFPSQGNTCSKSTRKWSFFGWFIPDIPSNPLPLTSAKSFWNSRSDTIVLGDPSRNFVAYSWGLCDHHLITRYEYLGNSLREFPKTHCAKETSGTRCEDLRKHTESSVCNTLLEPYKLVERTSWNTLRGPPKQVAETSCGVIILGFKKTTMKIFSREAKIYIFRSFPERSFRPVAGTFSGPEGRRVAKEEEAGRYHSMAGAAFV